MSQAAKVLKIKVNHLEYKVLPLSSKNVTFEGRCYGMHIEAEAIYIDPNYPGPEQARIMWHELVHAMCFAYNIPKKPRDEEEMCGALESALAGLHRDNPHLFDVMTAAFAGKPIVRPE